MAGLAPNKEYMARFHAKSFQLAYRPGKDDMLEQQLQPGFCQSRPKPPNVNGNGGPLYGRSVIPPAGPPPVPSSGFQTPYIRPGDAYKPFIADPAPGSLCYQKSTMY